MCNNKPNIKDEDYKIHRLFSIQEMILSNERLMEGIGTRHRYDTGLMALNVFNMARKLYEHTIKY